MRTFTRFGVNYTWRLASTGDYLLLAPNVRARVRKKYDADNNEVFIAVVAVREPEVSVEYRTHPELKRAFQYAEALMRQLTEQEFLWGEE